nr:hypothetical protein [Oscillochloris trichoides]
MNDKKIDQSHHSEGNSAGAGNHFAGPVQIGNTVHGPVIHGGVHSGRDTHIAGGDQIITNAPEATDSPLTPPPLRLWLSDPQGVARGHLAVGEEALLRLELAAETELPALTLLARADGVTWLAGTRVELRPRPGQPLRLPQWAFVADVAGPLTLTVLVLAGSTLLQSLSLSLPVGDAPQHLGGSAGSAPAPQRHAEVIYDLRVAPSLPTNEDAITLFFARGGETLRLVLLERGQSWDVPLPLTDHDLASLTQRAHTTLRDLILHQPGRALSGTLRVAPAVRDVTLRRLADLGAGLWTGLFNPHGASSDLHDLRAHLAARSQRSSLQITIVGHRVALPWQLLSVGQPDPDIRADSFWGLRHEIAVQPLPGRKRASTVHAAAPAPRSALLAFNLGIDQEVKMPVIAPQRAALAALGLSIHEVTTEARLRDALISGSDAALLYLYGHMRSPLRRPSGPTVDMDQMVIELTTPAQAISLEELRRVAPVEREPRLRAGPLVLINACSSGEQTPLSFGGLVPYLLDLGAQAVIGTAVETPIHFAAAFGPDVIGRVFGAGQPVGAALLAARISALAQHDNPLGLLYELFGNAMVW